MGVRLFEHQKKALGKMRNGCILCGDVGSGKSITSIAYYYLQQGGDINSLDGGSYKYMKNPKDLYIITTARKRDQFEWDGEMIPFLLNRDVTCSAYDNKVIVDSWNNISKYKEVTNAFFIFDEQRVVGSGTWVKSFLKITKTNDWILLSATPGDTWSDYIPVFLANGFYKNRTQFINDHVIYSRFSKYPKIDRYMNVERLNRLRRRILVEMPVNRKTIQHHEDVYLPYDKISYKELMKNRWNPWEEQPIKNASELCYSLRKIVNSDRSRIEKMQELTRKHGKVIIFYNFDYELELIRKGLDEISYTYAEWNGHKHQPLPDGDKWAYIVQYTAGAEGWNCIRTNTTIFFSQNYSYKVLKQSTGRIDRINTLYIDLYYYHFKSYSPIDLGIGRALKDKKKFNESGWAKDV